MYGSQINTIFTSQMKMLKRIAMSMHKGSLATDWLEKTPTHAMFSFADSLWTTSLPIEFVFTTVGQPMHVLLWQSCIPSFPDFHGNNLFFPHLSKVRTEKTSITFHSFLSKLSKHYRSLQHEHPMKEKGKALLTEDIVIFSTPTQTFLKFTILKNYNPQTAQAAHSVILISWIN